MCFTEKSRKCLYEFMKTGPSFIVIHIVTGGDTTLTDRESCLSILKQNVAFNNLGESTKLRIQALEWGGELSGELKVPFDVILGM